MNHGTGVAIGIKNVAIEVRNAADPEGHELIRVKGIECSDIPLTIMTTQPPPVTTTSVTGGSSLTTHFSKMSSSEKAAFVPPVGDCVQISNIRLPSDPFWKTNVTEVYRLQETTALTMIGSRGALSREIPNTRPVGRAPRVLDQSHK
jgi:hypothetical protein